MMFSKIPKEIREIVIFPRGTDREQPLSAETAALHQELCWELGALGVHTHRVNTMSPLELRDCSILVFYTWDQSQTFSDSAVDTEYGNAPPEAFSSLLPSTCPLQSNPVRHPSPSHTQKGQQSWDTAPCPNSALSLRGMYGSHRSLQQCTTISWV